MSMFCPAANDNHLAPKVSETERLESGKVLTASRGLDELDRDSGFRWHLLAGVDAPRR
jgi:hypothetical protein